MKLKTLYVVQEKTLRKWKVELIDCIKKTDE